MQDKFLGSFKDIVDSLIKIACVNQAFPIWWLESFARLYESAGMLKTFTATWSPTTMEPLALKLNFTWLINRLYYDYSKTNSNIHVSFSQARVFPHSCT